MAKKRRVKRKVSEFKGIRLERVPSVWDIFKDWASYVLIRVVLLIIFFGIIFCVVVLGLKAYGFI